MLVRPKLKAYESLITRSLISYRGLRRLRKKHSNVPVSKRNEKEKMSQEGRVPKSELWSRYVRDYEKD